MLAAYLGDHILEEIDGVKQEDLTWINFKDDSGFPVLEALKKMIFSHCEGDAPITVIKNINQQIAKDTLAEK